DASASSGVPTVPVPICSRTARADTPLALATILIEKPAARRPGISMRWEKLPVPMMLAWSTDPFGGICAPFDDPPFGAAVTLLDREDSGYWMTTPSGETASVVSPS